MMVSDAVGSFELAGQHEPHFHVHVVPRYKASDPIRRFLQRDYPVISINEQRAIAEEIRKALAGA